MAFPAAGGMESAASLARKACLMAKTQRIRPRYELSHVYALHDPDRGATKLGRSVDPDTRKRNLQTGSSVDLILFHVEPVAFHLAVAVDRRAAAILIAQQVPKKREWFRCVPEQVREAIIVAHIGVRGRNT